MNDFGADIIDLVKIIEDLNAVFMIRCDQIGASVAQQLSESNFIRYSFVTKKNLENHHCLNVVKQFVMSGVTIKQPLTSEEKRLCIRFSRKNAAHRRKLLAHPLRFIFRGG